MTGQGSRKSVGDDHWKGRLNQAREFCESARSLVTLEACGTYNPAITLMAGLQVPSPMPTPSQPSAKA